MQKVRKLINTELGFLLKNMGKNDKKFFKGFFMNIMQLRTTIMTKLGTGKYKNPKKMSEKIKHFFEKESFQTFVTKVEKRCFSMLGEIQNNDYIVFDEVDIAKKYSKKLEKLSKIRDASSGEIVNGYMFHGVSIRGIPVILQYEDLQNNFKGEYFADMIERVDKYAKGKGILVLDAGYDIASYIEYLQTKKYQNTYIIRAKRKRFYTDIQTQKRMKLKEFNEGIHKVKIEGVTEALYLYVKKNPKYEEPMRILSNSRKIDIEDYKERREIETIFKTLKQEFDLEKIRTQSFLVFQNFVATIQLAMALNKVVFQGTIECQEYQKIVFSRRFRSRFDWYTKRHGWTMNANSIVKFLSYCLKKLYKPPKIILTKKKPVSSQLRLF